MSEPETNDPISKPVPESETAKIMKRIEALERAHEDKDDLGYTGRQVRYNKWLTIFTCCLAILTLFLVLTGIWAICISKTASDAAKKSADAATAALQNSIESFRTDERAWVEIEPIKPIPFSKADGTFGASFLYDIYLKNVGKTVARDIVMRANRVSSGIAMGDDADKLRQVQETLLREYLGDNNRMQKVLAPNAVSAVPFRLHGQEPQNAFYSFLVGRIDYVDAFSVKHWMTFCFAVSNARGELISCKEGNDEDRNSETSPDDRR